MRSIEGRENKMLSNGTRDVHPDFLEKCKDTKVFGLFVEFVRQTDDLELCFRGNDSEMGTVKIYRNNHLIWQLETDKNGNNPKVGISVNHCRFMSDWDDYFIRELMEIGFKPTNKKYRKFSYWQLKEEHLLARQNENGKNKNGATNVINLKYYIDKKSETEDHLREVIRKSYVVLSRVQNEYFNPLEVNMIDVPNDDMGKVDHNPINFVKAYCNGFSVEDTYKVVLEDIQKPKSERIRLYARPQPCIEKHVQQEIFRLNHNLSDGLFIYDLEFTEPGEKTSEKQVELDMDYGIDVEPIEAAEIEDAVEKKSKADSNKPDMFAIRYDDEKPVAISLVEVKSTETAFVGTSGVREHLEGMIKYISKQYDSGEYAIDRRKDEAARILKQYSQLGLCGLREENKFEEGMFSDLPVEIIFVFSHGFCLESEIKNVMIKEMIEPVLEQYGVDKREKNGLYIKSAEDYSEKVEFGKESQEIHAYRYEVVINNKK